MSALVFIDTNIFLDFYRVIGREGGLSILKHLNKNHSKIITTCQVEMEFKKNRQRVVLEAYKQLSPPSRGNINFPAFIVESKQALSLTKKSNEVEKLISKLKDRVSRILTTPNRYDIVSIYANRLFMAKSPYNLYSGSKDIHKIKRMAWNRFIMGYPPRKDGDTSLGDAINWEWMIKCSKDSGKGLIVVSRDSDYGQNISKSILMNDWLVQEYKQRVSRKRNIVLTDRLTEGFKLAGIKVTKKEEKNEEELIDTLSTWKTIQSIPISSKESDITSAKSSWDMKIAWFVQGDKIIDLNKKEGENRKIIKKAPSNPPAEEEKNDA